MKQKVQSDVIDRREAMIGVSALALASLMPALTTPAQAAQEPTLEEALKSVIGDVKPVEGKVALDLPEVAENGNTVPFTVSVDDTDGGVNQVKAIHVFATKNPNPNVASFYFSVRSGRVRVSSRMRLGGTQDVLVIAEMRDGSVFSSKKTVKVTIGGCGG